MRDMTILFKLEKQLFLNNVKNIVKSPKRLIMYAVYIAFMTWVILMNVKNVSRSSMEQEQFRLYFSSGAFVLITFLTYTLLQKASIYFRPSDIALLFTAPIQPKKILLMTMLKKIPASLLTAVFTLIFILSMVISTFKPEPIEVVITCLGYALVFLIVEPISFAIFVIGTKTIGADQVKKYVKIVFLGVVALVFIAITKSVLDNGLTLVSVLEGVNNNWINWIPIIGWGKFLVLTALNGATTMTYIAIATMVVTYCLLIVLVYHLGDDYYEDVIVSSADIHKVIENAREGKAKTFNFSLNRKKTNLKDDVKYAGAFYWKRKLLLKRSDISIYFSMETVLCVAMSLGVMLFAPSASHEFGIYMVMGFYLYGKLLFSMQTFLDDDLQKPYFYLIPDTPFNKILKSTRLDTIRFFINTLVITGLHIALYQNLEIDYAILPFAFTSLFIVMQLSSFMFNLFLPSEDLKRLTVMFKMLQMMLFILPAFVVTLTIGIITENTLLAFSGGIIVNIMICGIFLGLSSIIFERMELK